MATAFGWRRSQACCGEADRLACRGDSAAHGPRPDPALHSAHTHPQRLVPGSGDEAVGGLGEVARAHGVVVLADGHNLVGANIPHADGAVAPGQQQLHPALH